MGRNDSGREGGGREGRCRCSRMQWGWTGLRWLLSVERLTGEQPDEGPGTRFDSRVVDLPEPPYPTLLAPPMPQVLEMARLLR